MAVVWALVLTACAEEEAAQTTSAPSPSLEAATDIAEPEGTEPPPEIMRVRVRDLVGKSLLAAKRIWQQRGLHVVRRTRRPSEELAGTVLDQTPAPGSRRREGAVITIVLAKPKPKPSPVSSSGGCTPGYSPCIPPGPDVDCFPGSGNGPRYEGQEGVPFGPFQVTGSDPYGLDSGGEPGMGCES